MNEDPDSFLILEDLMSLRTGYLNAYKNVIRKTAGPSKISKVP